MAISEAIQKASNWTTSTQTLLPPGVELLRQSTSEVSSGYVVLELGSQELPPALCRADAVVVRALAKGADGLFPTRTRPESPRILWAPAGVFVCAGLETAIGTPDADFRQFAVQRTPISVDPTPRLIGQLREAAKLSHTALAKLLGVSRQALHKWEHKQPITPDNRRRLLAVLDVFDRARKRYPTEDQFNSWLYTPCTEDGKSPAELIVAGDYDRARYHAVASPAPEVRPLPDWATRPISAKFAQSVRSRRGATPAEPLPKRTRRAGDE